MLGWVTIGHSYDSIRFYTEDHVTYALRAIRLLAVVNYWLALEELNTQSFRFLEMRSTSAAQLLDFWA